MTLQSAIYALGYFIERNSRFRALGWRLECVAARMAIGRGVWTPNVFTADIQDKTLLAFIERRENWKNRANVPDQTTEARA